MARTTKDFIEALLDPDNWKPNLSDISEQTGLARSTVRRKFQTMQDKGTIEVHVVEYAESEALKRKTED